MYARTHETGRTFFEGVCGLSDQACISSDPSPPHLTIRQWLYASTVSGDSRRSESRCSPLRYIVPGNKPRAREWPSYGSLVMGLCSRLNMAFREFPFPVTCANKEQEKGRGSWQPRDQTFGLSSSPTG